MDTRGCYSRLVVGDSKMSPACEPGSKGVKIGTDGVPRALGVKVEMPPVGKLVQPWLTNRSLDVEDSQRNPKRRVRNSR